MKLVGLAALPLMVSCLPFPEERAAFTLLQADVGAVGACDESAVNYGASLCVIDVERTLRDAIFDLAPDIVALQSVLPDDFCATNGNADDDERFVCGSQDIVAETSQARRLLGEGFVINCSALNPATCLGVRIASNPLAEESSYGVFDAESELPEGCDPAFTVGRGGVLVQTNAQTNFLVMIGALEPGAERTECRVAELNRMFESTELFGERLILTGSFNVDPSDTDDEATAVWTSQVGDGARFRELSGALATTDDGAVVDHVVSDLAEGTCETLGASPGTTRLDGGSGTDHRAISCALTMPTPPPNFE